MPLHELSHIILETSLKGKYYYLQETGLEKQNELPEILTNEKKSKQYFPFDANLMIKCPEYFSLFLILQSKGEIKIFSNKLRKFVANNLSCKKC